MAVLSRLSCEYCAAQDVLYAKRRGKAGVACLCMTCQTVCLTPAAKGADIVEMDGWLSELRLGPWALASRQEIVDAGLEGLIGEDVDGWDGLFPGYMGYSDRYYAAAALIGAKFRRTFGHFFR